jgi:hypothetical protein
MSLPAAIGAYHDLLTDALAQDTQAELTQQLHRRGLHYGERPLCNVLRPRFLTARQYRFLEECSALLLRTFQRIHQVAMKDGEFRKQFGLLDWEETLLADDPGFAPASPLSRMDAFFVHQDERLRFTEYNAETPAGNGYNDVLAEVFLGLPVMREFLKQYDLRWQPTRHLVMHALLDAYGKWCGSRQRPRIAILDWHGVPTHSEFVIMAEYLRERGFECIIADPQEAEYHDNKLRISGVPVDLIYKRVLISELVERGGLEHPVIKAVRNRAVCMVNPFRCKILHKKLSLAVLSDERNRDLFAEEERAVIDSCIPWSRRVEERRTQYRGRTIDLLPFAEEQREQLVLKPNDDYGGRGILLGWETTHDRWSQALQTALHEPFVIQERIEIPTEPYPILMDQRVRFEDRILDSAPYAFHGQFVDGCLTRLSTSSLVNVTAGGGSGVPTFIVAAR